MRKYGHDNCAGMDREKDYAMTLTPITLPCSKCGRMVKATELCCETLDLKLFGNYTVKNEPTKDHDKQDEPVPN